MISRAEAEAVVRQIGRTCRGPLLFSKEQQDVFVERGDAALASENLPEALLLKRELEIILNQDNRDCPDTSLLKQRLVELIFSRADMIGRACGYDVNNVVCSVPFDGQLRYWTCPKCGQTDYIVSPWFHGLPESALPEGHPCPV